MTPDSSPEDRVNTARNIWLATVRPDGRPHLVPIWFVRDNGHWYICTGPESVKARNLQNNPRVTLALEDGDRPYVLEGLARLATPSEAVVRAFQAKYEWDITTDAAYGAVFEITVARQVLGP